MNTQELKEEQIKLAKKVVLKDDFSGPKIIAGLDHSYSEDNIISCIVLWDIKTEEIVEKVRHKEKAPIPYIPGFLSYREMPSGIAAFQKLKNKPDIIMVDGNGILHPRKIGIASHIGILLDMPTIGIAKKLLCGEKRDDTIYLHGDPVAKAIATKKNAKPIYISPGHRISLRAAVEISKKCFRGHKLPEPLHLAHKFSVKLKGTVKA